PSTEQGLDALRKKPDNLESWSGPYLPKPVPPDAWNRKYFYKSPGDHGRYDLYSYGRDGKEGGKEYLDKDIVSWE
ncbi:MAG: type II secretion system protein GspG, partial [Desulfobacteraceae bacterium]|nr:type II secretion system protein GspG [Desulfobacteraceae bacterium]